MAGKTILTPAQRTALFDPPSDLSTIERLYTLGTEELSDRLCSPALLSTRAWPRTARR